MSVKQHDDAAADVMTFLLCNFKFSFEAMHSPVPALDEIHHANSDEPKREPVSAKVKHSKVYSWRKVRLPKR